MPTTTSTSRFAALWGVALLYHQLGYGTAWASPADVALTVAAATLIVSPNLAVLAVAAVAHILVVGVHLPAVYNHWWFAAWISAAVLAAMLPTWRAHRAGGGTATGTFMASFAAPARLSLVILYLMASFHKLNTDFLTPGISCATTLATQLGNPFGVTDLGMRLGMLPVGLTLAAELGIPLLLLFSRTRLVGLLAALGFHLAMAMAGYPRFSSTGLALLVLFLPAGTTLRWIPRAASSPTLRLGTIAIVVAVQSVAQVGADLLMLFVLLALIAAIAGAAWQAGGSGGWSLPVGRRSLAQLVPACVLLIGCLPYLGLATDRSWGMYSNLRVEGGTTNHLLIPASSQPFEFERDLVAVQRSDGRRLAYLSANNLLVPWVEFRAMVTDAVARQGDRIGVTYLRNGRRHDVPHVGDDPVLSQPAAMWHRKLFRFRPIEATGPRACSV